MKRILAAAAALSAAIAAHAQSFPARPVHLIVPFAAGGGPDVQARQFGVKFADVLGQPVVVENKVGAAGVLAANYVAEAKPDGYTLLLGAVTHLVLKHLQPEVKFDPFRDFAPVTNMASSPTVLVVRSDHAAKSIHELVALARQSPGRMNYSSGGIGTAAHLAGASFQKIAGFQAAHIPLKGSVEIAASLLRGDTDFSLPISGTAIPQVKSGKLRALAVSSAARMPELPGVPTLLEVMKNDLLVQESWYGIWAPAKTPADVQKRIHAAAVKALADPVLANQFAAQGALVAPSASPEEFAAFVRREHAKWGEIIKLSAAKAD